MLSVKVMLGLMRAFGRARRRWPRGPTAPRPGRSAPGVSRHCRPAPSCGRGWSWRWASSARPAGWAASSFFFLASLGLSRASASRPSVLLEPFPWPSLFLPARGVFLPAVLQLCLSRLLLRSIAIPADRAGRASAAAGRATKLPGWVRRLGSELGRLRGRRRAPTGSAPRAAACGTAPHSSASMPTGSLELQFTLEGERDHEQHVGDHRQRRSPAAPCRSGRRRQQFVAVHDRVVHFLHRPGGAASTRAP